MDKISIIVPVYNVERFLRQCIRSILRQTYTNFELILVDDGSPDNCGRICDAFAREDDRIKVIHRENGGVCAARNSALKAVTGDYIGFIDPDDYIEPDMFEYLLAGIKEYDADISCCGYYRVLKKETVPHVDETAPEVLSGKESVERLLKKTYFKAVFWNKLWKKELFDGFEFPEGLIYEGTWVMHKLLLKSSKVVILPEAKYYYVDNEGSYVNDKSIKNQFNYLDGLVSRYHDLIDILPDLKHRMVVRTIREVNVLTKLCYLYKDIYKEYVPGFAKTQEFLKENKEFLDGLKFRSAATRANIDFVLDPTDENLNKAHEMQQKYDGEEDRKISADLEAASKRVLRKKKMSVNIDDLTIEDKEIFDRLHKTELELLDELVRICDKYGLKYYLYGGTLLGAVRHKGFIPWDDDIDIAMPREDYDRLTELSKTELGEKYYYQALETDMMTPYLYAKIRKNNTWVQEEWLRGYDMHQGIFIDIMPLDYFPEASRKERDKIFGNFNVLHAAAQQKRITTSRKLYKLKYDLYYSKLPKRKVREMRDKYIRKVAGGKKTSLVCSFGSHYKPYGKRVFPAWWFTDDGTRMEFEGKMYMVPAGWKEYLVHLYGENYMEWPPVNKRVVHFNYYEISFDTSKENANG